MRDHRRVQFLAIAAIAGTALLAACSQSGSLGAQGQTRASGGTATVALSPGDQFDYILPLLDFEDATGANIEYSEYLMWRPLYWFGGPGSVGFDPKYSLADPAAITSSGTETTATVRLKSYRWSDGHQPGRSVLVR